MSLKLQVATDEGESKLLLVLIDTGAQVNLVRRGLFASPLPAQRPVALRSVGGDLLQGGDRTQHLLLHFKARDYGQEVSYTYIAEEDFYEAEVDCDLILGYPFLRDRHMSPILHRKKLLWERKDRWTWLMGGGSEIRQVTQEEKRKDLNELPKQRPKPRTWVSHDYAVKKDLVKTIVEHFGGEEPSLDAFASKENRRFPRYWDVDTNAFSKDWSQEGLLWMNPPFETLEEVVDKIVGDQARAIVVVPEWPHRRWWKRLQDIKVAEFKFDPKMKIFLRGGTELLKPPRFKTWAFLVHGALAPQPHSIGMVVEQGMRAWPEGRPDHLTLGELMLIEEHLEVQENFFGVKSVVKILKKEGEEKQHITRKTEEAKSKLLAEFAKDVLSGKLQKDPPVRGPFGMARIELMPGAAPRRQRSFKMVGEREEALKEILEDYIKRGWLEPSFSEWGSPCFVVPKKTPGEWRLVVDYRSLNEVTLHDSYELPLIADLLQKQCKKRLFTVLDMKKGYHQMPLDPKSRPYTAMTSHVGLLQWRVMPMGAKNGNAAFQRMMTWILRDCPFAWAFVDDVIIASEGDSEERLIENHIKEVGEVLRKFREYGLVCDLSKAHFFEREVEFCGHVLGHGRRVPSPGKLKALEKWPRPSNVTELRAFLGFCNWYSDYVEHFAKLAGPLQELLHLKKSDAKAGCKKKIPWTVETSNCFEELKKKLLGRLELNLMDPDKDFTLRTDASGYAVGCVVEQEIEGKLAPVAFGSRKLTTGQRKWSPREQETYAIVSALKKFAGWIGHRYVHVVTDHECLQSWYKEKVDTPSGPTGRRGRWHELLSKFNLEISYKPGKTNVPADAMSRWAYPACKALNDVSTHGSKEDSLEVKELIALEDKEDLEEKKVSAAKKKEKPASKDAPVTNAFLKKCRESVLCEDWTPQYDKSPKWSAAWKKCHDPSSTWPENFQLRGDKRQFMYLQGRLCVPESLSVKLIDQWHSNTMGHCGVQKMLLDMKSRFWIEDLKKLVQDVRRGCQLCQACDKPNWNGPGHWQSTPIPDRPMDSISLDLVSMSPDKTFEGKEVDACFVVVDRLTGWVAAWPVLKKGFTAKMAALLVYHQWFDVVGTPSTITSDLGSQFSAAWWRTLCALKGVHHATAISYRSQSNGRAEKACSQVLEKLRLLHINGKGSWVESLPQALSMLHDILVLVG